MEIRITDRLFINPASFGAYSQNFVHHVLREVSNQIDRLTGHHGKTVCHIYKFPHKYPLCMRASESHNIIFLSTEGNYWCQWVYQFAHEYLHHVINGSLSGDTDGVIWFEETLAELSSIYQLGMFYRMCLTSQYPILRDYAPLGPGLSGCPVVIKSGSEISNPLSRRYFTMASVVNRALPSSWPLQCNSVSYPPSIPGKPFPLAFGGSYRRFPPLSVTSSSLVASPQCC